VQSWLFGPKDANADKSCYHHSMITFDTPIEVIQTPLTDSKSRQKVLVANALRCIGISASNKKTYAAFEELLGKPYPNTKWPLNVPFRCWKEDGKWQTQGVSTCGLVAEGIARMSGVDNPCLWQPYWPAQKYQSVTRTIAWATKIGAWHLAKNQSKLDPKPLPGDYVIIGCRSAGETYGGIEHAFTVVAWEDDVMVSVDGGQVDESGLQCIKLRRRKWEMSHGKVWVPNADPRDGYSTRRVLGWVWQTCELVPYRSYCHAPQGWESVKV